MLDKILQTFTENDTRPKHNPINYMGKSITNPQVNKKIYTGLLPPNILKNKTVLDFGPWIFLSGAWSLYHGAKHVTGVEYDKENYITGKQCMNTFYTENWQLENTLIEKFIANNDQKYDVILIAGTIHKLSDKTKFLEWCVNHSDYVIIDSNYPPLWHYLLDVPKWWKDRDNKIFEDLYSAQDKEMMSKLCQSSEYGEWFQKFLQDKLPLYQHSINTGHKIAPLGAGAKTTYTSPNYYEYFFKYNGWQFQSMHSDYLTEHLPDYYTFPRRYCVAYKKVI
jgi:predicted RNA methylase